MGGFFVALWLVTHATPEEAAALSSTDPQDLSVERAAMHIEAARTQAMLYGLDPDVLLSIAWHESRYHEGTVTKEPWGRVSCGVMTPVPKKRCDPDDLTVMGGYRAGASHYRQWLDICRGDSWCADISYAGGTTLVGACRRHSKNRACGIHQQFSGRANAIRRALAKARGSS